ncbi:hypothetical protein HMPREF0083_01604 [Aneurinibacillus aneurinilyticus ATCC 12856]|jgi:hypothetical protein|uniref:Uncharacterized protein n=1 Tax=Aneurinibacillus aneurinilyticus ATCC 12856 TaxID=649747 RepID=U1X6W1_ANEAE|nr:hypothetical protein HMPREF0083_01604 [Aneurinibacillus aneurinilyticus ATCC 12856]
MLFLNDAFNGWIIIYRLKAKTGNLTAVPLNNLKDIPGAA